MNASELSRLQHPLFARLWQRISAESETRGTAEHRTRLLAGLTGRVVEVGAGNGLNFRHYPAEVTEVIAVEPDDTLRGYAERAAADAPVPVRVVGGHAGALPADDSSRDAAIVSLVLCSVDDVAAALGEIRRVLRPGGQLRFFEHVRSRNRLRGLVQDVATPVWSLLGGGCRPNRDTTAAIESAGFAIAELDRFSYAPLRGVPSHSHVLGRAHPTRA